MITTRAPDGANKIIPTLGPSMGMEISVLPASKKPEEQLDSVFVSCVLFFWRSHLRILVYLTLEFTPSRFSKIHTLAGKAESCHQPTCQPAGCSMQFIIALSIFDSDAKISFLRRCLLLAAIWFQPTLNYSNDHTRHWSCKSMYIAMFPFFNLWTKC